MSLNNTTNWRDWDSQFRQAIWAERAALSDKSYEWEFAKSVLQQVTGLNPGELNPQHTVTIGNPPRSYRIDFAILKDGIKYAIEVHGFDKSGSGKGPTSQQQTDRNKRERELMQDGWVVLNFSNSEISNDPRKCRLDLEAALSAPVAKNSPMRTPSRSAKPTPKTSSEPATKTRTTAPSKKPQKAAPPSPRNAQIRSTEPPVPESNKSNRGSITLVGIGIFLLIAFAISLNSGSQPGNEPVQSQFEDPANPNCQEFVSRAQLDDWVRLNPALVEEAQLDGDGDGKVCESYNYPDE